MDRACRQKGCQDRARGAWQAESPEPRPKKLPQASKEESRESGKQLNESWLVLLPGRSRGAQQSGVFLHGFFQQRSLLRRQFPILLFHGLSEPGEFQVRVGVARRIEKMLKPRPARNARGIEPVGFDLQQLLVEAPNLLWRSHA